MLLPAFCSTSFLLYQPSALPTRFLDARNEALARHVAETNPANSKLAIHGARPAAKPATKTNANLVARLELVLSRVLLTRFKLSKLPFVFHVLRFGGHRF